MIGSLRHKEPIICYWGEMTIGDIAFCLLSDLFTDSSYARTTMPGADWNEMLGPSGNLPAWEQLYAFTRKHGTRALQVKWRRLWNKYGAQMSWDPKEQCFRLKS